MWGPVIRVVGPDNPVVPVHSAVGASHSSGSASPFSGGTSHSSGGATPFSGGASHSSGRASRSSGGASRSSGDASPVGGSSEDGDITTHMGIKEIAGKSRSIQKKKSYQHR